jgi:hypothetical protein
VTGKQCTLFCNLRRLCGETKLEVIGIKDDELGLEHDITVDGETNTGVALETTVAAAGSGGDRCVVQVSTWDGTSVIANTEDEIWESGAAGENVTSLSRGVGGAGDLCPVGLDNGGWEEEKGGSGVSNAINAGSLVGTSTNLVSSSSELPEAVGVIDIGVWNVTRVLSGVDVAEVVVTGLARLQVGGPDGGVKSWLSIVEPGLDRGRGDGVDAAESKTKETVSVAVTGELGADGLGGFDSLLGDGNSSDLDDVVVDDTAGGRSITVGDRPGSTGILDGSSTGTDLVGCLTVDISGGGQGGENPAIPELAFSLSRPYSANIQIRGAGIKVKVEGLSGSTDFDGAEVLAVVLSWCSNNTARASCGEVGPGSSELDVVWYWSTILVQRFGKSSWTIASLELCVWNLIHSERAIGSGEVRDIKWCSSDQRWGGEDSSGRWNGKVVWVTHGYGGNRQETLERLEMDETRRERGRKRDEEFMI